MFIFHTHEWTEWQEYHGHYWDHANFNIRYCKHCPEKEYSLMYLHATTPQGKPVKTENPVG